MSNRIPSSSNRSKIVAQKPIEPSSSPNNANPNVGRSFYVIKIQKELQDKINIHLFNPTIYRFVGRSVISDYLGYCTDWTTWYLPKKLYNKNLKIVSFDKTQITVGW
jgi:hypothetical protein